MSTCSSSACTRVRCYICAAALDGRRHVRGSAPRRGACRSEIRAFPRRRRMRAYEGIGRSCMICSVWLAVLHGAVAAACVNLQKSSGERVGRKGMERACTRSIPHAAWDGPKGDTFAESESATNAVVVDWRSLDFPQRGAIGPAVRQLAAGSKSREET